MKSKGYLLSAICVGVLLSQQLSAAITKDEAERLRSDLTPVGAERAGNADGSIPAWTGEAIKPPAGYQGAGDHHPDPFKDDKPLITITAENLSQHAEKLTVGQKALFKAYPDTFKMNVYPSRRTANYPNWYVDNIYKYSQTAELESDGNGVIGARAAVPFPIPKTGIEVIWNHLLRFQGVYRETNYGQVTPDVNGRYVLDKVVHMDYYPYYVEDREDDGMLTMFVAKQLAPQRVAGDAFLFQDYVNPAKNSRNVWRYINGQRRVRRAPVFVYDTPIPPSYGYRNIDDFDMYFGAPDKYEWKLVGKKEIYIPYNNYKLQSPDLKIDDVVKPFHINPDYARYELHRTWVVEAVLKDGERHNYKKRVMYIDEDSWSVVVADKYDNRDNLWRVSMSYLKNYWEVPVTYTALEVHHDIIARRYNALPLVNEETETSKFTAAPKESFFTPATLRRSGTR